jgi:hypothetical protein
MITKEGKYICINDNYDELIIGEIYIIEGSIESNRWKIFDMKHKYITSFKHTSEYNESLFDVFFMSLKEERKLKLQKINEINRREIYLHK